MSEPTTPQLTEAAVREIEARANIDTNPLNPTRQEREAIATFRWNAQDDIEALIRDWRALRAQLTKARTVIDAACALSCAGCAANLPLDGNRHEPTKDQKRVGYIPDECGAYGAVRILREITETLK